MKLFASHPEHKYLFILSPPYCGSTLMAQILCTSKQVSINNTKGNWEGQQVKGVRKLMFDIPNRWSPELELPWPKIKRVWRRSWNLNKPVLVDKSPPNIVRAAEIQNHFSPAYFILLIRDPLAFAEGLMRRNGWDKIRAADFVLSAFRHQYANIQSLERFIVLPYEQLAADPEFVRNEVQRLIPELNDLDLNSEFTSHNFKKDKMGVVDLNEEKIQRLSKEDRSYLENRFRGSQEIAYFRYA